MKGINLILNQIWWVYNLLELTEDLAFGGFTSQHRILVHSGPYKEKEEIRIKNLTDFYQNLNLKDGNYKVGIRPHNITTYKEGENSIEINGKVLISELSGSESLIHFTNGNLNWVSLSNGIQQKNIGENTKLFMNIDEFLYFDENNRLVNHG